jgi:replication factor A1
LDMEIDKLRPRISVDTIFKVVSMEEPRFTRDGTRVADALVGDSTGTVLMTLWRDQIDEVKVGETYKLINGYTNLFRGSLRLTLGREGRLEATDEDVGEVNTENNLSDKIYPREERPYRRYRRY